MVYKIIVVVLVSCGTTTLFLADAAPQQFSNTRGISNIADLATGPFAVRTVETPGVANTPV